MRAPGVLPDCELSVIDKNPAPGGTWWEANYAGCCCDTPAHTFTYEAEPNPYWSSCYASSPEIFKYLSKVADKYNIHRLVRYKTRATKIVWNETKRVWRVTLAKEEWVDDGGETGWEGEKGWDGGRREILKREGLLSADQLAELEKEQGKPMVIAHRGI